MAAWLSICLLMAFVTIAGSEKLIHLQNNCAFNVWPALASWNLNKENEVPKEVPEVLRSGASFPVKLNSSWSGTIWGRLGCSFNSDGIGTCESGDCGGKLRCDRAGFEQAMPTAVTTATFADRSYQVSVEFGYNLPMAVVVAANRKYVECVSMACTADVARVCPKKLQILRPGNEVAGCKGQCDSLTLLCSPPEFGPAFQTACPDAFPFQQPAGLCSPFNSTYTLTFCPDPTAIPNLKRKTL